MNEEFTLWLKKAKESLDDAKSSLGGRRYGLTLFAASRRWKKS